MPFATRPDPDAAQSLLRAGLERHQSGDLAAAVVHIAKAMEADPTDPTAPLVLGLIRYESGDAIEAARLIEMVVALKPDHVQAWRTLGQIRQGLGQYAAASEAYRQTVSLAPADAQAQTGLSQALLEQGDLEGALAAAEAAIAADRGLVSARMALAAALARAQRHAPAADAYRAALALAPDLAAAELGLALALLQLDAPLEAAPHAERAATLAPNVASNWFVSGVALRAAGRPGDAVRAFSRAAELGPDSGDTHRNLGLAYADLHDMQSAERNLAEAVRLDPSDAFAHASLSSLYCSLGQMDLGRRHALCALELDPGLITAHENLARIYGREGRETEAKRHRDIAYGSRSFFVAEAAQPEQRVLLITATDTGNTPDKHLLPGPRYTRIYWFVEYGRKDGRIEALPPYDVVFNAIGDQDETTATADNVAAFLEICERPLFNHPDRIARTCRHMAPDLFAGIEGLVVPGVARLDAADLTAHGLSALAARAGLQAPLLLRPLRSHGGEGMVLVDDLETAKAPAEHSYATEFRDFRSADGLYRKYRMIFVDRRPYPYHLAIGSHWLLHYESSGTVEHAERRAEELRFLEDPEAVLGPRAMAAIQAVADRLDLDYAGIDFALLENGEVLLFEANATMLVHPDDPAGPLAHKNPYAERIFAAFQAMLKKGSGPRP